MVMIDFLNEMQSYFRNITPLQAGLNVPEKHIYVYSFALEAREHQPSGTCNFSRIDTAQLKFSAVESNTDDLHLYAVNYNVLRIMSEMGGMSFTRIKLTNNYTFKKVCYFFHFSYDYNIILNI